VLRACLADYGQWAPAHREHAGEIQRECGYRDFSEESAQAELLEWLDARARAAAERPSVLFDLATARLIEAKMLSWLTARAVGVAFVRYGQLARTEGGCQHCHDTSTASTGRRPERAVGAPTTARRNSSSSVRSPPAGNRRR
jgi:hypothetical protein